MSQIRASRRTTTSTARARRSSSATRCASTPSGIWRTDRRIRWAVAGVLGGAVTSTSSGNAKGATTRGCLWPKYIERGATLSKAVGTSDAAELAHERAYVGMLYGRLDDMRERATE